MQKLLESTCDSSKRKENMQESGSLCTGRSCFLTRKVPCQMGMPALSSASSLIPLAFSRQTKSPLCVCLSLPQCFALTLPIWRRCLGSLLDTSLWWLLVSKMCFEAQFSLLLLGGKGWGRWKTWSKYIVSKHSLINRGFIRYMALM